jgi:glycosyltransferase involved in cell wall biosynthesis
VGGVEEAAIDGVTGVLVEPHNPDALARAIASLLADKPRRDQMSEASKAEAQRRFGMDDWLDRTETVFREAQEAR